MIVISADFFKNFLATTRLDRVSELTMLFVGKWL
jgi:hypothetical protein